MSYLVYVAGFGVAVVVFLWLRDLRIYYRTGLSGYRTAAYQGVLFTALALLALFVTWSGLEILGLGLVLAALFLQGRLSRERVWHGEGTLKRFLGEVERRKDKGSKERK
ncbi:ABC transporter permease [Methanoculleus sp. FWC-SCC1]|uniref:ABC transporter permease n=1 Tax=Methanoculleus frigidifontis TaxID=2584085 RepID=A0ABT8M7P8_9EURY|nr:ABC transporter permease [Methanoculleus sp. FWC-SCC1]MDN7023957.1 ABC transporter permease [Methanoculleus sp. FWC-SCC1]